MTDPRAIFLAQIRWSDSDVMGHVNHARYLTYFEDARMEMLARSPTGPESLQGLGIDRSCIAARITVTYVAPVIFSPGLTLRVRTGVAQIGTASWTLTAELDHSDAVVARADVVLVAYSYQERRSRPLDEDERTYWKSFLVA